ncbi:MAG TPA: co-chaperone GroES [Halanaerobiales bacterium]|nr:co-chaperone GroES [Halanaerobiales bacterium]
MSVKPLGDRVAVKLVEREEKTEGGIVIPDTAKKEKPQTGEIYSVGRECYTEEETPEVEKGDMVVFDKFAGTEVTVDGVEFKIVNIDDIVAVIG